MGFVAGAFRSMRTGGRES